MPEQLPAPRNTELNDQARAKTRSLLAYSQSFRNMDRAEQMALYKDLVDANYNDLATQSGLLSEQSGLSTEMATAGDLINDDRHNTPGIQQSGRMMGGFVKDIDFPGFVRDLVTGVFDANQDANERQMEAYMRLLDKATRSLSAFVNEVKDTEALVRLTESNNQYKLKMAKTDARRNRARPPRPGAMPSPEQGAAPNLVLTDQNGKEVNLKDDAIQAKLLDAKLALAKERRTMLRETILMGVSRLVVEKGTIRASVNFKIDSAQDTYNVDDAEVNQTSTNQEFRSPGLFGGFFGGTSRSNSRITIANSAASSESNTATNLSAEMTGFVEIQFKSDYFKLDNFTQMFDLGQGQVPQAQLPASTPAAQPQPQPLPPAG